MDRRGFLSAVGASWASLMTGCVTAGRSRGPATNRPNVIIILTDDQGYGDMSCHGNPFAKTPQLDRLWADSVRLTDFHVDPTCSPTRAALMTGRYASRTGVWLTYAGRHHLRRDEVTMADVFGANGYRTAIFGKWHLGDNYPFRPNDRGFGESLIHGGGVGGEAPDHWGNDYDDDTYRRNGRPERVRGYCTDVWFDEAIRFIAANRNRPFFLYLPPIAPGVYSPDKYTNTRNGIGITWGLCHTQLDYEGPNYVQDNFLVRFECDLSRDVEHRSFKARNHRYSAKTMLSGKNKLRENDLADRASPRPAGDSFLDEMFSRAEYNID